MTLPCYEFLKLNSIDPSIIIGQLHNFKFGEMPIVIIIDHLAQNQMDVLSVIEKYLSEHAYSRLPYSTYIIADCPQYNGPLFVAKGKAGLPQFFNKRPKALNSKESIFLNKIVLKQENFKNLSSHEYSQILKKYAKDHKKISHKQNFLVYLEKINKGLQEFYGKKE